MPGGYWGQMTQEDGTPHKGGLAYRFDDADAFEALEELYGMVWALAVTAVARRTGRPATRVEALEAIRRAQLTSDVGAALGRGGLL